MKHDMHRGYLRGTHLVHQLAAATAHEIQLQRSLLELEGLGAEFWQGIDA